MLLGVLLYLATGGARFAFFLFTQVPGPSQTVREDGDGTVLSRDAVLRGPWAGPGCDRSEALAPAGVGGWMTPGSGLASGSALPAPPRSGPCTACASQAVSKAAVWSGGSDIPAAPNRNSIMSPTLSLWVAAPHGPGSGHLSCSCSRCSPRTLTGQTSRVDTGWEQNMILFSL